MLNELKKFAKTTPIYVTVCEKTQKSYAYAYNENTIGFYELDGNVDVYNDLVIPNINQFDNIGDAIHSEGVNFDDAPFDFSFDSESEEFNISKNNFVKSISQFNKFYDVEDYRAEFTGLHIRKGTLFASDGTIMRLKKSKTFPATVNMIVDITPIVEQLGVNNRKVKSTGTSLFASKKIDSDNLKLSIVTNGGNDALKIKYKSLTYMIISVGKSELDFADIKSSKPTNNITVHRESLINNITKLINTPSTDSNAIKDFIRFTFEDNLELTNYIYHKKGEVIKQMNYSSPQGNIEFTLNGQKLVYILKELTDTQVIIHYEDNGMICRLTSKSNTDLLLIAQTTYK